MYAIWYGFYHILSKTHRYSLGQRIDTLFIEALEAVSVASFLVKEEKASYIRLAIRKLDTLKVLLMVLWETKSLDTKKYALLGEHVEAIGKMLGGWQGQLAKLNPAEKRGEK